MSVFTGARVSTPTTTIPSGVATIIEWTTEDFDDGDWFDPLAKTEYVVPAGITRVVVTTGCGFPSDNAGYRSVEILHTSGATVTTRGHVRDDAADSGKTIMHTTTGPLDVAEGDRLSVRIKQNSGSDLLLKSDVHGSYFSVEDATEGEAGVSIEDHDLLENRVTVNEDDLQSQDIRLDDLENAPAPSAIPVYTNSDDMPVDGSVLIASVEMEFGAPGGEDRWFFKFTGGSTTSGYPINVSEGVAGSKDTLPGWRFF